MLNPSIFLHKNLLLSIKDISIMNQSPYYTYHGWSSVASKGLPDTATARKALPHPTVAGKELPYPAVAGKGLQSIADPPLDPTRTHTSM